VIHFLNAVQIQSQTFTNKYQIYYRPDNLPTALELCEHHADAYLVNGGSDLVLQQSKKFIHFPVVIDLSAIAELNEFREEEQAYIIGSGLNFEEVLHKLEGRLPVIEELLSVFASKQIRNLATFGGNIGSASPIGDTLPVLFALKASLGLVSASGVRIIPVETFIKGYRKTDLKTGELILNIVIPKPDEHSIVKFYKVSKRKDVDISTVSLAARLKRNSDNEVAEIILAYGGMAEVVKRATLAEGYLLGKRLTEEIIHEACKLIDSGFEPISDARSGNEARKIMAKNLLVKLFAETCQTPECYA
jgi:xanthine dehydrogenase iron-sulfur cluster and FAD-binding subunit A